MEFYPYIESGFLALRHYLFTKMAGAFIPAFFIAGGLATLVPRNLIVQWLSAGVSRLKSYPAALFGGGVLSVCACGILPLFQTVYQRGAGVGPAVTFLFAGPAFNVIAILYTFDLLGLQLGVARLVAVMAIAVCLGLLFEASGSENHHQSRVIPKVRLAGTKPSDPKARGLIFASLMAASLILPAEGLNRALRYSLASMAILTTVFAAWHALSRHELVAWMEKTWFLISRIVPKLFAGIFLVGALEDPVRSLLSQNMFADGFLACLFAALIGGVLYLGTIIGVVVVHGLIQLGMPHGPALAFMLAGPTLCLPSLWVIISVMGRKQGFCFAGLVVILSSLAGYGYSLCIP